MKEALIFLLSATLLLSSCKKEDVPANKSCDVMAMLLDDHYAWGIMYDHFGRVWGYDWGSTPVRYDYSTPGKVHLYYGDIFFRTYKLNEKGLAFDRITTYVKNDSASYKYDDNGFLVEYYESGSAYKHTIENGNRTMTLIKSTSPWGPSTYHDTIRYYYNHDSLALFNGGTRLTFLGKMYTNRLKYSVRTSKNNPTTRTDYYYEYNAEGQLQLIREVTTGGMIHSNTGWYMYWKCE